MIVVKYKSNNANFRLGTLTSIKQRLLINDTFFGFADIVVGKVPRIRKRFGEAKEVYQYLNNLPDPVILDFGSFKLKIDRNSTHDRDVVWEFIHNRMLDPLLSKTIGCLMF